MDQKPNAHMQVTCGGQERIKKIADILAGSFGHDPVYTYVLNTLDDSDRTSYLPKFLHSVVKSCVLNGGKVFEVGDWSACGVAMPPGTKPDSVGTLMQAGLLSVLWKIGISGCKRLLLEYPKAIEGALARGMTESERAWHWYGIIMCTIPGRRQSGLSSAIIQYVQDCARNDGTPFWLEAGSPESRQLYLKYGFEDMGEAVIGQGIVSRDGLPKKDGEGIIIWPMVWRPDMNQTTLKVKHKSYL